MNRRTFHGWVASSIGALCSTVLFDQLYRGGLGRRLYRLLRGNPRNRSALLASLMRIRNRRLTPLEACKQANAFYLNANPHHQPRLLHFANKNRAIRFPMIPGEIKQVEPLPPVGPPQGRVDLRDVAFGFEQLALDALEEKGEKKADYKLACDLMLSAVQHDVLRKGKVKRPNFRAYDLLAGLVVRANALKKESRSEFPHLEEMIRIINQFDKDWKDQFESRLKKWNEALAAKPAPKPSSETSSGAQRWRERWEGKTHDDSQKWGHVWIASVVDRKRGNGKNSEQRRLRLPM
jgi:hypothetical protein